MNTLQSSFASLVALTFALGVAACGSPADAGAESIASDVAPSNDARDRQEDWSQPAFDHGALGASHHVAGGEREQGSWLAPMRDQGSAARADRPVVAADHEQENWQQPALDLDFPTPPSSDKGTGTK
jgi:hypothetical protein